MEALLARVESAIDGAVTNVVNVKLESKEMEHVDSVRDALEEGFRYASEIKSFDDWKEGPYKVLAVTLDGATGLVVPHAPPTLDNGVIGS